MHFASLQPLNCTIVLQSLVFDASLRVQVEFVDRLKARKNTRLYKTRIFNICMIAKTLTIARLKLGPVLGLRFSYRKSFSIIPKKLFHDRVDGLRSGRGRPAIHDVAILIDQELFKVPL